MRTAIVLLLTLFLGNALATPSLPSGVTTCGLDLPLPCAAVFLGDIIVFPGQTQEYNDGTYTFQGNITVEPNGTLIMDGSQISFGDESPVHVKAGGTIVIEASSLQGSATEGAHTPIIRLDAGAIVTIVGADFTALTVSLASDDATLHDNSFQLGFPAIALDGFDGEIYETFFQNNIEGINATGGTPTFHDLEFIGDALGINLDQAQCTMELIEMRDVQNGIRIQQGACTMTTFALDDQSLPPDVGVRVIDGVGQSTLSLSDIREFGTGVYYCNATIVMSDNTFSGNGQDVDSCD